LWRQPSEIAPPPDEHDFWALRDVSFEVHQGEVVGIIGRNGAGKSTLLKILSRITEPSVGEVDIYGRVGSLLEVGTGFHPDLTGRENIFLNGTILGMRRREVQRRFDEIVAFAEVDRFIDTPVKHYSSGMYVRLAFAVAAHLEPEILIVDEVLAVGDAEFQRKSLGRIHQVASEGRTVLFVSHALPTVQHLCTRALLFNAGQILAAGDVEAVVREYVAATQSSQVDSPLANRSDRVGGKQFRFTQIDFLDRQTGQSCETLYSGQDVLIRFSYQLTGQSPIRGLVAAMAFFGPAGNFYCSCRSEAIGTTFVIQPGVGSLYCRIRRWPFSAGTFTYNLIAQVGDEILDWIRGAGTIGVELGDYYGTGKLPATSHQGVYIEFEWVDRELEPPRAR
jgi:lipopolysaccharide transport system ATP-binding protein